MTLNHTPPAEIPPIMYHGIMDDSALEQVGSVEVEDANTENLDMDISLISQTAAPSDDEEEEPSSKPFELKNLENIIIYATDWTTETISSQIAKGNINLNPSFQRRDAWNKIKKSRLIESMIIGLPVPPIVLAEQPGRKGSFVVLDGKQRLLTIMQFYSGEEENGFNELRLSKLDLIKDLDKKTLREIKDDPSLYDYGAAFENQSLRTVIIKGWKDEDFLNIIFLRLNSENVPLSPQELRQALNPGAFMTYIDSESSKFEALHKAMRSKGNDFRMRDAELLLRYFAYQYCSHNYSGNLKRFLDDAAKKITESWDGVEHEIHQKRDQLEKAIEFTFDIFKDYAFYKHNGNSFETRFNRAVFDIMTYYFSDPQTRQSLANKQTEVMDEFVRLSSRDGEFVKSLESTTKSIEANQKRFRTWLDSLNLIANEPLDIQSPI